MRRLERLQSFCGGAPPLRTGLWLVGQKPNQPVAIDSFADVALASIRIHPPQSTTPRVSAGLRYATAATLAILLLASATACRKRNKPRTDLIQEEPAGLVTMLHTADPRGAVQLLRGFHDVENDAWRWAAGDFAVTLRVPKSAAQKGANLVLKFAVAEPSIQKFGSLTVTGKLDSMDLKPEKYTAAGPATYTREIPANALTGESVTASFKLDKFIPASDADQRDLGVIVSLIGLEVK